MKAATLPIYLFFFFLFEISDVMAQGGKWKTYSYNLIGFNGGYQYQGWDTLDVIKNFIDLGVYFEKPSMKNNYSVGIALDYMMPDLYFTEGIATSTNTTGYPRFSGFLKYYLDKRISGMYCSVLGGAGFPEKKFYGYGKAGAGYLLLLKLKWMVDFHAELGYGVWLKNSPALKGLNVNIGASLCYKFIW